MLKTFKHPFVVLAIHENHTQKLFYISEILVIENPRNHFVFLSMVQVQVLDDLRDFQLRMGPCKNDFYIQVQLFLFCNSSQRTETLTGNRWRTTYCKPLGPIIMRGPIKFIQQNSNHICYTISLQVQSMCCAFYQPLQRVKLLKFLSQTGIFFTFLHPILPCRIAY